MFIASEIRFCYIRSEQNAEHFAQIGKEHRGVITIYKHSAANEAVSNRLHKELLRQSPSAGSLLCTGGRSLHVSPNVVQQTDQPAVLR